MRTFVVGLYFFSFIVNLVWMIETFFHFLSLSLSLSSRRLFCEHQMRTALRITSVWVWSQFIKSTLSMQSLILTHSFTPIKFDCKKLQKHIKLTTESSIKIQMILRLIDSNKLLLHLLATVEIQCDVNWNDISWSKVEYTAIEMTIVYVSVSKTFWLEFTNNDGTQSKTIQSCAEQSVAKSKLRTHSRR